MGNTKTLETKTEAVLKEDLIKRGCQQHSSDKRVMYEKREDGTISKVYILKEDGTYKQLNANFGCFF